MLKNIKDTVVYHASYAKIKVIDLNYAKKNKDFGKGFYVTTDKKQAFKFAKLIAKRRNESKAYINLYKLVDLKDLDITEFSDTDEKWINCVIGFRKNEYSSFSKKYTNKDIIIGKIADDETSLTLNTYLAGGYGKVGSKEASALAIKLLKPETLSNQICFRTKKSLKKLTYIETEMVNI